ncbi:MAG: hypothetical protein QOJ57_1606 [Thermoleophilaceae bacterium]|nr:hypothetical protein [Thermoleophilaceae bacterium]
MGGLDAATVSVPGIEIVGPGGSRSLPGLPSDVHDAAAAPAPGGGAYLFGGGEPSRDAILHVTPAGRTTTAGRLPAPASDVAAAAIGSTYYVVGGFTGTQPLRTIVAWQPGSKARVVARLPIAVRYAAVAAAGNRLVIAGGSTGTSASRAVYAFDPAAGAVKRIATLPRPLTHAAAATLGGFVYVIGGRGATLTSQTAAIRAIDARTGRVTTAGRLPRRLSDAGAVSARGSIVLAGGRDAAGQVRSEVLRLEPR